MKLTDITVSQAVLLHLYKVQVQEKSDGERGLNSGFFGKSYCLGKVHEKEPSRALEMFYSLIWVVVT